MVKQPSWCSVLHQQVNKVNKNISVLDLTVPPLVSESPNGLLLKDILPQDKMTLENSTKTYLSKIHFLLLEKDYFILLN